MLVHWCSCINTLSSDVDTFYGITTSGFAGILLVLGVTTLKYLKWPYLTNLDLLKSPIVNCYFCKSIGQLTVYFVKYSRHITQSIIRSATAAWTEQVKLSIFNANVHCRLHHKCSCTLYQRWAWTICLFYSLYYFIWHKSKCRLSCQSCQ